MEWVDYYDRFYDWAESTQISRISGLTGFDSSAEVAEIVCNIFDSNAASRLVRKAMAEGVTFTADEVIEMLDFLNDDIIEEVVKTCKENFSAEQLETLSDYCMDDTVISAVAKRSGVRLTYGDFEESPQEEEPEKEKRGFGADSPYWVLYWGATNLITIALSVMETAIIVRPITVIVMVDGITGMDINTDVSGTATVERQVSADVNHKGKNYPCSAIFSCVLRTSDL